MHERVNRHGQDLVPFPYTPRIHDPLSRCEPATMNLSVRIQKNYDRLRAICVIEPKICSRLTLDVQHLLIFLGYLQYLCLHLSGYLQYLF
jgi:hypothetical protein